MSIRWKFKASCSLLSGWVILNALSPLEVQASTEVVTFINQGNLRVALSEIDRDTELNYLNFRICQSNRYKGVLTEAAKFEVHGIRVEAVPGSVVHWCSSRDKQVGNFAAVEAHGQSRQGLRATYRDSKIDVVLHAQNYLMGHYSTSSLEFIGGMAAKLTSAENRAKFSGKMIEIQPTRGDGKPDSLYFTEIRDGDRSGTRFHSGMTTGLLHGELRNLFHHEPGTSPLAFHHFKLAEPVSLRPRGLNAELRFQYAVELTPSAEVVTGKLDQQVIVDFPSSRKTLSSGEWVDFYQNGVIKDKELKSDGKYHRGLRYGPQVYPVEFSASSRDGMCRRLGYDGVLDVVPRKICGSDCSVNGTYLALDSKGETVTPKTIESCQEGADVIDWIECGRQEVGTLREL